MKNELLRKKTKRNQEEQYLTAQKAVKNYRERQKSHSAFKRTIHKRKTFLKDYDITKENTPILAVRISG